MVPPLSSSLPSSLRHTVAHASFVSHLGLQHGDYSVLLVRERPSRTAACERFVLHGAFDPAAVERLAAALRGLPPSALPLTLDLRGVTSLEESCLPRLLKLRRELSGQRPVSFQIADDGPVPALLSRLGLEERFGFVPARLPLKRTAAPVFTAAEKTVPRETASREFAVR